MTKLIEKNCIPCQGGVPPIEKELANTLKNQIHENWMFTHNGTRLERNLKFKDFAAPYSLLKEICELAENEWHHPELHIGFGHLDIEIWTHKINALVESDFIFAAKCDEIISNHK